MNYFPEPHDYNKSEIKVEINLSNYAKYDLKNATGVSTSDFCQKC